jgi:hypothetical protein
MVDVKVASSGECERDGAGIDDSSLGMTIPLYVKERSATIPLMREGSRINNFA